MDLLNTIKVEYSQHKKFLYKKLTTYTMISIKNKVKENKIIKDNFVEKINELYGPKTKQGNLICQKHHNKSPQSG